jgi:hypothetical protein
MNPRCPRLFRILPILFIHVKSFSLCPLWNVMGEHGTFWPALT